MSMLLVQHDQWIKIMLIKRYVL